MSELVPMAAAVAIGGAAAVSDLATRRIPNVLTLGGVGLGVVMHAAMGLVDVVARAMPMLASHKLLVDAAPLARRPPLAMPAPRLP